MQVATAPDQAGQDAGSVQAASRVLQAVACAWVAAGHDTRQMAGTVLGNTLQMPGEAQLPLLNALQQALPTVSALLAPSSHFFVAFGAEMSVQSSEDVR